MPLPILPVIITALIGGAYLQSQNKKMSPHQKEIYEAALKTISDPEKLRVLARGFDEEGFRQEADQLFKLAMLKDLPKDVIKARRAALQKGLASTNKEAISQ